MAEKDVAKVVPDRIFSIVFHPSPLKTLVVAGDKCGRCAAGRRRDQSQ